MKVLLLIWLFGGLCSKHVIFGEEIHYTDKILDVNRRFLSESFSNSSFLMEGDIIKKKSSTFSPWFLKWLKKNGTPIIPYTLSSNYSSREVKVIKAAIDDLHAATCVRFQMRLNEPSYISIEPAMGCFSYVGRIRGMQPVSLARECLKGERGKGVALHELMHVIGFSHEHSRADRDDYIRIDWDNIADDHVLNFCKADTNNRIADYDPKSILHYSRYAFSKNGLPTISPLQSYADWEIGQRFNLSASDIFRINKLYSCPQYKPSEGELANVPDFPQSSYSCEKPSNNVSDSSGSQEGIAPNATASVVSVLGSTKEPIFNLPNVHILSSTHGYNGMLRLHHMVTSSQSTASASSSSSHNMPLEESTEKYGITLTPAHLSNSVNKSISSQAPTTRVSEETSTIFLNNYALPTLQATKGEKVSEVFNNTGILEVGNRTVATEIQAQNTNVYKGPTTSSLFSQSVTEGFTTDLSFNRASEVPAYAGTVKEIPVVFSKPPIPIIHNTEAPVTVEGPQYGSSPQNVDFKETATTGLMLNSEHFGDGNPSSPEFPLVTDITLVEQMSTTISTSLTAASNGEILLKESILVTETPVTHLVANLHIHTSSASDHDILQVNKSILINGDQSEGINSNTPQTNVSTFSGDIFSGYLENTFDELDNELNAEYLKQVGKRSLPDDVLPVSESTKSHALPRFSDWLHSKPKTQKTSIIKSLFVHKKHANLLERPQKLKSTVYNNILKSAGTHSSSIADSLQIRDPSVLENTMKSDISTLHLHQKDSLFPIPSNGPYHKQSTLPNIPNNTTSQHRQLCGFELGFCGWSESNDDHLDWIPIQSKNYPRSGSYLRLSIPRGVHLSLRNSSRQLFPGQKAILLSPIFNSTNCISFWYGSLKHPMGTLNVYTRLADSMGDWTQVWSVVGQRPMEWRKAKIRLQASDGWMPIQVALEGIAGPSTETNIVLDNLYAGKCR